MKSMTPSSTRDSDRVQVTRSNPDEPLSPEGSWWAGQGLGCRATAQERPRQPGETAPPATTPPHRGGHPCRPCTDIAAPCAAALRLPPRGNPSQKQQSVPSTSRRECAFGPAESPPRAAWPPNAAQPPVGSQGPLCPGAVPARRCPGNKLLTALTLEKKAPKPWERGTKPPRDALGHTRAYRLYRLGLASRCPAPGARAELRGICPQEGPPPPVTAGWHPHLRRQTPSCRSAQGSQALCRQQGDPRRGRPDHATRPAPALCLAAILCHNFFSLSLRTLLLGQLRR